MKPGIASRIKVIKQDKVHGASWLSEQAILKIAKNGADIIQPSDIAMTCSYSSTVCQSLEIAGRCCLAKFSCLLYLSHPFFPPTQKLFTPHS